MKELRPVKLLPHLRADCFDDDDAEEVMAEKTEQAKADALLRLLPKLNAFESFWIALGQKQPHLADMLNKELGTLFPLLLFHLKRKIWIFDIMFVLGPYFSLQWLRCVFMRCTRLSFCSDFTFEKQNQQIV